MIPPLAYKSEFQGVLEGQKGESWDVIFKFFLDRSPSSAEMVLVTVACPWLDLLSGSSDRNLFMCYEIPAGHGFVYPFKPSFAP